MNERVTVNKTLIGAAQTLLDELKRRGWDYHTQTLANVLQNELDAKYEADKRRRLYTTSKTATDKADRETARQLYLDSVGIKKDFRWSEEENPNR